MKTIKKIIYSFFIVSLCLGQGQKIPLFLGSWWPLGFNIYLSDILALFIIAINYPFFLNLIKRKIPLRSLGRAFLLFIFAITISLLINLSWLTQGEIFFSIFYLLRFLIYSMVIACFLQEKNLFHLPFWPSFLTCLGLGIALIGLGQFFLFPDLRFLEKQGWDPHFFRLTAPFLDPDFTGIILTLFFLFFLEMPQENYSSYRFFSFAIIGLAIILTFSRASFLALGGGAAVISFFRKKLKKFTFAALLTISLILAISFYLHQRVGGAGTNIQRISTIQARMNANRTAIKLWKKKPLWGIGFNTYPYAKSNFLYQPLDLQNHSRFSPPNSFLLVLSTSGIIGFLFFSLLIFNLYLEAQKINQKKKSSLLLAIITALFIHAFFSNTLFHNATLVLAGAITKIRIARDSK